jgi:flagellar hook-length control protein FliK
MQALLISNPSLANAPNTTSATLLPFDPPSSSPFTAVFQAILKSSGSVGKFPVAGKPQDSSREPARTAGTANNMLGLFPLGLVAPPIEPILPELSHNLFALPVVPDIPLAQGQGASSNPLPLTATAGLAINSPEGNDTPPAKAALTATLPSTASSSNFVKGPAAFPNPFPLEATAGSAINSFQTNGTPPAKAELTATAPSTASTGNPGKGAAGLHNSIPLEAMAGPVINSFQTNGTSPAKEATTATVPSTASINNPGKRAVALPNPLAPEVTAGPAMNSFQTNSTPPTAAALRAAAPSMASTGNPANTGQASRLPRDLNAATKIATNGPEPQPNSDFSTGVSQPAAPSQNTTPGATAGQMVKADSNGPANPTNVFMTVAAMQNIPIALIADPNFAPQESGLPPIQVEIANPHAGSQPLPPSKPEVSTSLIQNFSMSGPNPPNSQIGQAAPPNPSVLSIGTPMPAAATTKVSVTGLPQPIPNQWAQANLQPLASVSPAPAETLAHSVAKSAAIVEATLKVHENLQPPGANSGLPAPVATIPAKIQTQVSSNGSSANDSNPKPDGASKVAGARAQEKTFVQSLDTAGANPMNGHSAAADSTAGAAAPPVQMPIASSVAPPTSPSNADPRPTESLPAAAQNAPVVNAAHIVNQSGQTEIRIEMQADSLGSVELRAHIAGDQIGASIAVEHHDAQVALATGLPALHSALVEKNLRVETLTVSQGNFSSLSGGPGQDTGQRGFAQSPAKFAYAEQPEHAQAFTEAPAQWTGSSNSSAGLSVVA